MLLPTFSSPSATLRCVCVAIVSPLVFLMVSVSFPAVAPAASVNVADVELDHDDGVDHDHDDHTLAGDHDAPHAAGHDDHGTPALLQFDFGSAIANLLIFLGVLGVLSFFVWPPILDGLKAREQKIHGDLVAAEKANEDARLMLEDYQAKLKDASVEVQTMLADSRKTAEANAAKIVDEAKLEAARQADRAKADIEAAKRTALAELADQTGAMAIGVARQVVGREINPDEHAELIRSSLDRLPSNN